MSDLFSDAFGGPAAVADASSSPVAAATPEVSNEPRGTAEVITPSGIEVYYQAAPKRLYRVNGKEVPSVTTILEVLDKPALPWWGMTIGMDGALDLMDLGLLSGYTAADGRLYLTTAGFKLKDEEYPARTWTPEQHDGPKSELVSWLTKMLTRYQLTVNHVRDQAGDRGQGVHDALESWATHGVLPSPEVFPETERGYVEGLRRFLEESKIVPLATEVMVGSAKHKYAGRYDLRALYGGHDICMHLTPQKEHYSHFDPGLGLWDLKTSKEVYVNHFIQLEGYEKASVEDGYDATDFRAVIHVTADGRYEVKLSTAGFDDFVAIKNAARVMGKLKVPGRPK